MNIELSNHIRSTTSIMFCDFFLLTVASSGIASQLIPSGHTAHSRFAIPIICDSESTCHIARGSDLAELIVAGTLIIWNEAHMTQRNYFEALDKTLRDIMRSQDNEMCEKPFGGKVVLFGGDFRQILPVIPQGSRQDIVMSCINSSYLWTSCKVLNLTKKHATTSWRIRL